MSQDILPTERDREAAVAFARWFGWGSDSCTAIEEGLDDNAYIVQAFARHAATARAEALEEAAIAARDCLCAQEWPPQDGDVQIDEVIAAIRALVSDDGGIHG